MQMQDSDMHVELMESVCMATHCMAAEEGWCLWTAV